jgi:hypothetical protein
MYKSCKVSVVCVPFSQRSEIFLPRKVQTGCGIHPVSYSLSAGRAFSPGVKWLGLDADYLPLSSAEVKDDSPSMPSRGLQGQLYILPSTDPQLLVLKLRHQKWAERCNGWLPTGQPSLNSQREGGFLSSSHGFGSAVPPIYPGVGRRIILRWIFRKWDWEAWTEFLWLRRGTGGGHL